MMTAQGDKAGSQPDWCGWEGPRGRGQHLRAPSWWRCVGDRPQNTFAASVAAWNLRPISAAVAPYRREPRFLNTYGQVRTTLSPRADPGVLHKGFGSFRLAVRRPPRGGRYRT